MIGEDVVKSEKRIVEDYSGEISMVEILAKVILETDIVKNYLVNADFEICDSVDEKESYHNVQDGWYCVYGSSLL